jgi:hypothetical protein
MKINEYLFYDMLDWKNNDTPDYRDCSLHVYLLAGFAGRKKEE